jgi:hypothetical protein
MKNKPIKSGFKIWSRCCHSFRSIKELALGKTKEDFVITRLELNRLAAQCGGKAVLFLCFSTLAEVSNCSKVLLNFQHSLIEFIL